jgi:hypothetical protein
MFFINRYKSGADGKIELFITDRIWLNDLPDRK